MTDRPTASSITDDQLDELYGQRDRLAYEVQAWKSTYGEHALRDTLARLNQAEAERQAEISDAVTGETKRLMQRRTGTLRARAEQAEAGRLAADNMLRAVCEVFGGPHQDPVVKARETLARATKYEQWAEQAEARADELTARLALLQQTSTAAGIRLTQTEDTLDRVRQLAASLQTIGRPSIPEPIAAEMIREALDGTAPSPAATRAEQHEQAEQQIRAAARRLYSSAGERVLAALDVTAPAATTVAVPADTLQRLVTVARHVSRGASAAHIGRYPDATARRALGDLDEASLTTPVDTAPAATDTPPSIEAVYAYIRQLGDQMPASTVSRNAMIWRAVGAALDAITPTEPCGHRSPVTGLTPEPSTCILPTGHKGWHRDDVDRQWAPAATEATEGRGQVSPSRPVPFTKQAPVDR